MPDSEKEKELDMKVDILPTNILIKPHINEDGRFSLYYYCKKCNQRHPFTCKKNPIKSFQQIFRTGITTTCPETKKRIWINQKHVQNCIPKSDYNKFLHTLQDFEKKLGKLEETSTLESELKEVDKYLEEYLEERNDKPNQNLTDSKNQQKIKEIQTTLSHDFGTEKKQARKEKIIEPSEKVGVRIHNLVFEMPLFYFDENAFKKLDNNIKHWEKWIAKFHGNYLFVHTKSKHPKLIVYLEEIYLNKTVNMNAIELKREVYVIAETLKECGFIDVDLNHITQFKGHHSGFSTKGIPELDNLPFQTTKHVQKDGSPKKKGYNHNEIETLDRKNEKFRNGNNFSVTAFEDVPKRMNYLEDKLENIENDLKISNSSIIEGFKEEIREGIKEGITQAFSELLKSFFNLNQTNNSGKNQTYSDFYI